MQRKTKLSRETAELNYGLTSTFLSEMDEDQKLRVFDLTTRTSRELQRWAAQYPLMRRVRVWPLSLTVAASAPFATSDVVFNMARMSLWIFTADDLFDEEMVPFKELQRRVSRYKGVLIGDYGSSKRERDTLALALQEIRQDLGTYTLFPTLQSEWANAASNTLNAMMREHEWRILYRSTDRGARLPSYDSYLSYAIYSIGGPPVIWTALIAINDESVLEHLVRLKKMEQVASLCLRLANDLRSHSKEIDEDNINSIVLRQLDAIALGYSPEMALSMAEALVQSDIQQGLNCCMELQQQARTATGHPERVLTNIAHFVCDFYAHHDYHTFVAGSRGA